MPATAPRHEQWLSFAVMPIIVALMWVAWLTPLMHLILNSPLAHPRGLHYPAWLVFLVLVGAGALVRALREHPRGPGISAATGVLASLGVLAYLLRVDVAHPRGDVGRLLAELSHSGDAYPAALLLLLATALIWLWGSAASWDDYGETFWGFVIGITVTGLLILVPERSFWQETGQSIWGYALLFVVTALLSLGFVSAHQTLAQARVVDPRVPPLPRRWLAVVGLVVVLVLAVGWPLATVAAPEVIGELLAVGRPVWAFIEGAIEQALLAFAYVIFLAVEPLIALLQNVVASNWGTALRRLAEVLEGLLGVQRPAVVAETGADWAVDRRLLVGLRILLVAALAGGMFAAFYVAYRRRRRREGAGAEEERESMLSPELLSGQWRSLLAGLRRRPPRRAYLPIVGDDPRLAIRRLYQRFLARASAMGLARPRHLTPRGYAHSLAQVLLAARPSLEALTEAYQVARYARVPPPPKLVAAAREALERVEAAWPGTPVR